MNQNDNRPPPIHPYQNANFQQQQNYPFNNNAQQQNQPYLNLPQNEGQRFNTQNINPGASQNHQNFNQGFNFSSQPFDYKDSKVRLNFIRKVYSILGVQLFFTFILTLIAFLSEDYRNFQTDNMWLFYVCIGISVVLIYALACYTSVARRIPINFILLAIFTIAEAYLISFIASSTSATIALMAVSLTAAVVISLTIYAFVTKKDFTVLGGFLFIALAVLIVGGILAIFIRSRWLALGLSIAGVIVFGLYLIYDTQLVIGKNSKAYSVDDYIIAALQLYLDIINIFLYILQILSIADSQFN